MKIFSTIFLLVAVTLPLSSAEESASDIAARITKSSLLGLRVKGRVGTDPIPNFTKEKRIQDEATDNAGSTFQNYMLSESTPEEIRICFAITILNRAKLHDERYWNDRLALGSRLIALRKAKQ